MRDIYLNILPKFDWEKYIIVEQHMDKLQDFTNNLLIEDDDVYMRLFAQTLEGERENDLEIFLAIYLNS